MKFLNSFLGVFITFISAGFVLIGSLFGSLKLFDFIFLYWSKILLYLARVELAIEGLEKLPAEPCLVVFNHQSLLDIPILFLSLPRRLRFGAKKELFYIPIFGWSLRVLGMVEIDRGNRTKAVHTLKKSIQRMKKNNLDLVLAPEGTRQLENQMGEFKTGPFATAIEAQIPILPVVIRGAFAALPKGSLVFNYPDPHLVSIKPDQRRVCSVEILDPIFTRGLNLEDRQKIKLQCREVMYQAFQKSQSIDL